MRISFKISLGILTVSALALLLLGYQSDQMARRALIDRTFDQLNSVNLLKHSHLYAHLYDCRNRLRELAEIPEVDRAFHRLITTPGDSAQARSLRELMDRWGMNDWALLGEDSLLRAHGGDGLSWWEKAIDHFDDRSFAAHWLIEAPDSDSLSSSDLVLVHRLEQGILLVQLPSRPIWALLANISGMGASGESYLVAEDHYMRSPSRFLDEPPTEILVESDASYWALSGKVGQQIVIDYRGIPVLSVYRPVRIGGLQWALLSEIDEAEALEPAKAQMYRLFAVGMGCMVVIFFVSLVASTALSRPILQLEGIVRQLSRGVLPKKLPRPRGRDEVADMQRALIELTEALRRRARFASMIGQGDLEVKFRPLSDNDELGHSLLSMREQLIASQQAEQRVEQERRSAWIEGEERERSRMARELHDGLGQILLAIRMRMAALPLDETQRTPLIGMLDEAVEESRRITRNLTPSILSDFGLGPALRELAQKSQAPGGPRIEFDWLEAEDAPALSALLTTASYRIVQEALSNALRHAKATRIEIRGTLGQSELRLSVVDDGIGFDPSTTRAGGLGLRNLKERVAFVGGELSLSAQPGEGTRVIATFPLPS